MEIDAINPVANPSVAQSPLPVEALSLARNDVPTAPYAAIVPDATNLTKPDVLPSLLQVAYRAPPVAHVFTGPFSADFSGSIEQQALLHVMAPTPIAPTTEFTHGRPFNPNTYALSPMATESLAAHAARLATGKPPPIQRITSESHEAFVGHSLDLFA